VLDGGGQLLWVVHGLLVEQFVQKRQM
jgi:hypothetical protein